MGNFLIDFSKRKWPKNHRNSYKKNRGLLQRLAQSKALEEGAIEKERRRSEEIISRRGTRREKLFIRRVSSSFTLREVKIDRKKKKKKKKKKKRERQQRFFEREREREREVSSSLTCNESLLRDWRRDWDGGNFVLEFSISPSHDAPRRQRFSYRLRQGGWVLQAGKLSLKTYCPTYYRSLSRPRPLIVESSADRKFKRGKCVCMCVCVCVYGEREEEDKKESQ